MSPAIRLQIVCLALLVFPGISHAQAPAANRVDIRGHYVGEPVARFLRLEPDAREDLDVCRQNAVRSICERLLAAVDSGARTEISTEIPVDLDNPDLPVSSMDFVLDGGKVVKLSMPVNDLSEIVKKFGPPTREMAVPAQNSSGAKWENHLTIWDTSDVFVTLYQDNNPSVEDHRPLLVLESREEHARENVGSTAQSTAPQ